MLTNLETFAAALKAERAFALKRAERLAPLLADAELSRPLPTAGQVATSAGRWVAWVRTIRCLRLVIRPSQT